VAVQNPTPAPSSWPSFFFYVQFSYEVSVL
jgi:hypothetical protein